MKIICVGRNYAAHAAEMKSETPTEPVIFLKPDTALLKNNKGFYLPDYGSEIHYECEIYFRVGKEGRHIREEFALRHLDAAGLGIDFTARDLQSKFKQKGLPWDLAKAFDFSAPVSKAIPLAEIGPPEELTLELQRNGATVQKGAASDMIFSIEQLVAYISQFITLKTGDLIFTGTPEGVGPVAVGDRLEGWLGDRKMLDFKVK